MSDAFTRFRLFRLSVPLILAALIEKIRVPADVTLAHNPSVRTEQKEVRIKYHGAWAEEEREAARTQIQERTGWTLDIKPKQPRQQPRDDASTT